MNTKVLLGSSLAVIAAVFLIVGPLSYRQEVSSGGGACVCITVYHPLWPPPPPPPPPPPTGLVLAALFAGLVLNFGLLMRQDPTLTRRAAAAILIVSAVSIVLGDEFWAGGITGVVAGLLGLMETRQVPART